MVEQPLISCIVPVYNGELYLREAIDSILAQTYRPLEVIVIDDGSTDGTADVAASYGDRLRYESQPNSGPAAARNRGIGLARGAFIAFQDADDVWHRDKLQRQMKRFEARPELELGITHLQNFWIPELEQEAERFREHRLARPLPGYVPTAVLARKSLFARIGLFDPALRLSEDTDWFLRAIEQRVVIDILPDVLAYRRWHRTNLSRQSRPILPQAIKASLDRRRRQREGIHESLASPASDEPDLKR
jgi:glycosyltransferase involved in cell wall biosynthesis